MTRNGRTAAVASTAATFGDGSRTGAGRIGEADIGGLGRRDGNALWVVAHGIPITQGSVRGVGAGHIKRENGPELHAWRNNITMRACMAAGDGWQPVSGPVALAVCLTVPWPNRRPFKRFGDVIEPVGDAAARIPPMGPPDGDKLLRAVQDALSPRDKGRFRVLDDDALIVDSAVVKTFCAPEHTHPWALDTPGAVIRVVPLGANVEPIPPSTLATPAELPAEAAAQHEKLSWQRH